MELVIFQQEYNLEESLNNFRDLLYSSQTKYLASDLLQEGLPYIEIRMVPYKKQ